MITTRSHIGAAALLAASSALGCGDAESGPPLADVGDVEWADTDFSDLGGALSDREREQMRSFAAGFIVSPTADEQYGFCACEDGGPHLACDAMAEVSPCFAAPSPLCFFDPLDALDDEALTFLYRLYLVRWGASACARAGSDDRDCDLHRACYAIAIPVVQQACALAPASVFDAFAQCPA